MLSLLQITYQTIGISILWVHASLEMFIYTYSTLSLTSAMQSVGTYFNVFLKG